MLKVIIFLSFLFSFHIQAKEVQLFSLPYYKKEGQFKLNEYLGKKTIVLNFWATWCTSCIEELPLLHDLKKKNPDAIFIAINSGERKKLVKKFLKRYRFDYTIVLDPDKAVAQKYGIDSLPKTIVISKRGKITFTGNRPPKSL